jgi:NodT family efflux transporter outer membrane factor (OMF) lipoprotein
MNFTILHYPSGFKPSALHVLVLLLAGSLGACANFDGIAPTGQLLDASALQAPAPDAPAPPDTSTALSVQWWNDFGDAQLSQIVEQAIAHNPSLRVAQARLERAQAVSEVAGALTRPGLSGSADLTHQLFTATGMYPPPLAGSVRDTATLQATGVWELDFFGKNRAALDAALGQVRAAQADAQAARMLLASSVTRSYFALLRIQAQLALAKRSLAQREQLRSLVQDRVSAGLDTQLELRQSEGALPDMRLQIEALNEQMQLARNALTALVSTPNSALAPVLPAQAAIKSVALAQTIPLDLLARRADIAAARQRVLAATRDMDSAKAQFYPNINLVAFAGLSSIGFDRLLEAGSQQWGVGPAIRLPLFDGGRLRANLRGKTADLDAAIASYNGLVIEAIHDVADQLASTRAIARQQDEQAQSQAKVQATFDIARQRFDAGLATSLQVLSAETAVLAQQRQAIDLAARALDTQVQLIRALGGGFQDGNPASAIR